MKLSRDRFRGCLLGLACGDATGCTLEFQPPGTFQPLTDMVGGGPFGLKAGEWTDDTSMALALADSLITHQTLVPRDVMDRWCRWRMNGEYSCTGRCFDIGITISGALGRYLKTGNPIAGLTDPMQAGNGCLMRLAPVPMMWANNADAAVRAARLSCKLTHGAPEAIELTSAFARRLVLALRGGTKQELLAGWVEPAKPRGTGYSRDCLNAALWCFRHGKNFRDTVLMAANLGNDADTTAAVAGQIAGAFYGEQGIPKDWLDRVAWDKRIRAMADDLWAVAANEDWGQ